MSQYTTEGGTYETPHSKPAIGLVATRENEAELTRTILQATRQGYDVLVTHGEDTEPEAVDLARMLDARIVQPDRASTDRETVVSALAVTAQSDGYPGLIHQRPDRSAIDYERSEAALAEDTAFATEAIPARPTRRRVPSIVVGIPAYNESGSIASVVTAAEEYADSVLVVDDGSRDETALVASEAGATVIEHEYNRGYGAALKTLFRAANREEAEHLVIIDADNQHDPADIPRLVAVPYRRQKGGTKGHSGALATAFPFGKPVVASSAGDFPRLVGESGAGTVVPPQDPEALADAIVDLLEDHEKRAQMADNSAAQAKRLSWDSIANTHLDLYESVLDDR